MIREGTKAYAASYLRRLIGNHSSTWATISPRINEIKHFPNEVLIHDTENSRIWKLTVTEYRGPRKPDLSRPKVDREEL